MRVHYAIGDVHGEADRLGRLHDLIADDIAGHGAEALIVHLGDLVDRGLDSRGAVERALQIERNPPAHAGARTVLGNHERMMMDALEKPNQPMMLAHWAGNGGARAIESYERVNGAQEDWRKAIDRDHIAFLFRLPTMLRDGDTVFVHGGIDPARFPHCDEEVRLWTRSRKFFDERQWPKRDELKDVLVLHGHTPTDDMKPDIGKRRINVDTGAVYGGPLTCVVITPGEAPRFLYA